MSAALPLRLRWNGEAFEPAGYRAARECNATFVVGEVYEFIEHKVRSEKAHRRFFACVNEAFDQLPEELAGQFVSPEHLRKWALIQVGYRKERIIVQSTAADAARAAALIRPMDEFAVIETDGPLVRVWTARTQKEDGTSAMGAKEFYESSQKVLALLEEMIGLAPGELGKNAGQSA